MSSIILILLVAFIANIIVIVIAAAIFVKLYTKTRAQVPLYMTVIVCMMIPHNVLGVVMFSDDDIGFMLMNLLFANGMTNHTLDEILFSWFPYVLGATISEFIGRLMLVKLTLD